MDTIAVIFNITGIASALGASVFWFMSASVKSPRILKPGDIITADDLNWLNAAHLKSAKRNRTASLLTGISAASFGVIWLVSYSV